jgi:hypothetical protein
VMNTVAISVDILFLVKAVSGSQELEVCEEYTESESTEDLT